jgi:phage terminase large subunit-like protein
VAFIDRYIMRDEKGRPFSLAVHQRRIMMLAFQWDDKEQLLFNMLLWGEMKKSGKTFIAGCLALWWAFTNSNTEIIIVANDLEQASGRVFRTLVQILKQNPDLAGSAKILMDYVTLSNGTLITAIASEYKGAAGSRHSLVVYDELWGFSLERAERLFEELTPPPTETNAWILIVTYAGWSGESLLLERLYKRGLGGECIDEELQLYRKDDLIMFWGTVPRQPWQTEKYYKSQRAILRPNTFARLHENKWVTSESTFITPELWAGCVDLTHRPLLPSPEEPEYIGIDIGLKNDLAAVVRIRREDTRLVLSGYRLWTPTAKEPLDLESTVEAYVRELASQGAVRVVYSDPWQAARTIATLKGAGIRIQDFPQTVSNTTRMAQTLYDLLKGRNLVLYEDGVLRQQAMNTTGIESPRGFRIAKEKASKKIDAIVALSMACCAALDTPMAYFDAFDPRPDDPTIMTVRRGSGEDLQEIDHSILQSIASGRWFR